MANIIKHTDIVRVSSFYENIMITHKNGTFLISYDDLEKLIKNVDFLVEKKKTREWGKPLNHPNIDFAEFQEFLLYNENISTEEMERILELSFEFFEDKENGFLYVKEEQ